MTHLHIYTRVAQTSTALKPNQFWMNYIFHFAPPTHLQAFIIIQYTPTCHLPPARTYLAVFAFVFNRIHMYF